MVKTYLYLDEKLNKKIEQIAKEEEASKASIIRDALTEGMEVLEHKNTNRSGEILNKLAEFGRKYNPKGPKDLSRNLDKYLWDEEAKNYGKK